ncbi:MAG: hypothetical protein ACLUDU_08130 [Butyricimonas faecihominis]
MEISIEVYSSSTEVLRDKRCKDNAGYKYEKVIIILRRLVQSRKFVPFVLTDETSRDGLT